MKHHSAKPHDDSMKKYKTLQELFANKKRWTKYRRARDRKNIDVAVHSKMAVKWCLAGGIYKIYRDKLSIPVLTKITNYIGIINIGFWNDKATTTIKDIRNLVKDLNI